MKATSTILYEVNFAEIKALPINYTVLQRNKDSGVYRLLKAHIDYFPFLPKFEYYLFKAPATANQTGGEVQLCLTLK